MLHSLSAQISYYSSYIQNHSEWFFAGVYAGEAITGTKESRPEFQRMVADCKAGKIDMIITKSISRFARNTVTLLETVRMLKSINVDVYFEEQNIHSMSGDGELMLTILASFAQEESLSASENIKWRIRKDFKEGKLPMSFKKMYGYRRTEDGGFRIIEEEAEVIRYVAERYLEGLGYEKIARELNEQGIKSPGGNEWYRNSVRGIITNEKYVGDLLLQKTLTIDHVSKKQVQNNGQLNQYYVEDNHAGILSKETYKDIQKERSKRVGKHKPKSTGGVYPFSKMIRCEKCGKNYIRKIGNSSTKYRQPIWNCSTYLNKGKSVCYAKQIPEDILYQITCEVLGISKSDEQIFKAKIKEMTVPEWNVVTFVFHDGTKITKTWEDKSRKWTDEMKAENYENLRRHKK
jgi:DNA invertase Pin-like site-specific DNA recombinase